MYRSRHFTLDELFSKKMIQMFGQQCWEFMDERILRADDRLRDLFGPIYINDWAVGGEFDSRGYRAPDDPDGAYASGHRRGQATDKIFMAKSLDDYEAKLVHNPKLVKNYNTTLAIVDWAKQQGYTLVVQMVRNYVLQNKSEFPEYTCVEDKDGWFHSEIRNCKPVKVVHG